MKPGVGSFFTGDIGASGGGDHLLGTERHVKEDSGNRTSLYLLRLCDRNLKGQLLY
jgi:hypothetical protein